MPILLDYTLSKNEDGSLLINMTPPVPVGGWAVQYTEGHRFGQDTFPITKSASSGFSGVSGVTITNSGIGQFTIAINTVDSSGRDYGAYAYLFQRTDPGQQTVLVEGFRILEP